MIKIIARELLSNDKWFNAFSILLDRWIWKSTQKIESENKTNINISKDDEEMLKEIMEENLWIE
jgi:hypothetical protein